MFSARSVMAVSALVLFGLLSSSCGLGNITALEPSATPTRTRRPTVTATATDTETPTATATPLDTATFTPQPPTATFTEVPATDTFTPRPPTATFTRRPPTLTFTPAPPTDIPLPPFPVFFRWVDPGHPFTANQCTNVNGTHVEGRVMRMDGSLMVGVQKTAAMHLSIQGDGGGPYAYPGIYRQFPTENDGRWNADLPKRATDFVWHIYISAPLSDDPISADLSATASAADKCGQPGTLNFFVADWVVK